MNTDRWEIDAGYEAVMGDRHAIPEATRQAILSAMVADPTTASPPTAAGSSVSSQLES